MVRLTLFFFILVILSNHLVSSQVVLSIFQQQALIEHNVKRQIHCSGSMTLNSTLNEIAQNYSEYLAVNNLFTHSYTPGLGENLYKITKTGVITYLNGSQPTDTWYNEVQYYNYSNPDYSANTGHFTQIVWKSSVELGIGITFSTDNKSAWVVAEYYPEGNVQGGFAANVPAPCTDNAGGD